MVGANHNTTQVGVAFTRYQTLYFRDRYGDLDSNLISFGPCQTPTLGFCVARHDEIQSFQPEPFWTLQPTIVIAGFPIHPKWERGRVFDHQVALLFQNMIGSAGNAKFVHATHETQRST